jgi:hypothetical protein
VLYALADDALWISTDRRSRKARNVAAEARVAVTVPVRRLPVGPPSSVTFQARAEVLELTDPRVRGVVATGALKAVTGHGELDLPDGCFLRVALPRRLHTYGLGLSLRRLAADPLAAGATVERTPA